MIPHSAQTGCLDAARMLANFLVGRRQPSNRNNEAMGQHIYDRLQVFFHSTQSHNPASTKLPYQMSPVLNILWRIQAMIQSVTIGPHDTSPVYQDEELPVCLEQINHAVDQLYELTPSLMTLANLETVVDHRDGLVILDTLDMERTLGGVPMPLQGLADIYSTKITTNKSRNVSSYEQQVTAELVRRLEESCIPQQNTRTPDVGPAEVAPSFSETLELYAAEYTGSANFPKLNHIHILGEIQEPPARDLERAILQCGKRLRLLNAPVEQCNLNFVQICPNPFVIQDIETMLNCIKMDKAVAGRVVPRLTLFDIFNVQAATYQNIVFSGLSHAALATPLEQEEQAPHSDFASLEQTPKDCEINIRGLSSYTDIETLRLQFSAFGTIIGIWFDDDPADSLTGANYDFQTPQLYVIDWRETRPSLPSLRRGPRPQTAKIIYARDDEAEAACVNMNRSRFDGEFIHVFMVKRGPVRQAVSPVPEGDGVHSRPTY